MCRWALGAGGVAMAACPRLSPIVAFLSALGRLLPNLAPGAWRAAIGGRRRGGRRRVGDGNTGMGGQGHRLKMRL